MLRTCFVMQCFDGAAYDKRYKETFAPAIERAGAKSVRADELLGTIPVIEKIESSLRGADVAFAEVSEDNPNVFLELGYALSLNVPTVIVCDKAKRDRLPFDIAHRPILFYSTDAQSAYEKIGREIEQSISAALMESKERNRAVTEGASNKFSDSFMDEVKSSCLIALLDQDLRTPDGSSLWNLQKAVSTQGISERMVALAIASLVVDQLVQKFHTTDEDGDAYISFSLTDAGHKYLLRSYSSLMQTERDRLTPSFDLSDEVPF